jgi:predicted RecA/RadA family phage recombinase
MFVMFRNNEITNMQNMHNMLNMYGLIAFGQGVGDDLSGDDSPSSSMTHHPATVFEFPRIHTTSWASGIRPISRAILMLYHGATCPTTTIRISRLSSAESNRRMVAGSLAAVAAAAAAAGGGGLRGGQCWRLPAAAASAAADHLSKRVHLPARDLCRHQN